MRTARVSSCPANLERLEPRWLLGKPAQEHARRPRDRPPPDLAASRLDRADDGQGIGTTADPDLNTPLPHPVPPSHDIHQTKAELAETT